MTTDVILVLCTAPPDEARAIARSLVDEQLVACVNTLPVRSTYRWKGAVEEDEEALLVMKTRRGLAERLRDRIGELHSYDVPEVLEVAVDGGLPAYLAWVAESCPDSGAAG